MRIWNRALITLLNPGGLEPEPGKISEFKDARKPKPNKAKPEPGPGTSVVGPYAGCQGGRGGGGGGFVVPSAASRELQTGSAPQPARSTERPGGRSELPFPPLQYQGGQGRRAAVPERCPRVPDRQVEARARARRRPRAPRAEPRGGRGGRRKRRARPLGPARRVRAAPALSARAPGRRGRGVRAARAERVAPAGPRPACPPRRSRLGPPAQGAERRAGRALSGAMRR